MFGIRYAIHLLLIGKVLLLSITFRLLLYLKWSKSQYVKKKKLKNLLMCFFDFLKMKKNKKLKEESYEFKNILGIGNNCFKFV